MIALLEVAGLAQLLIAFSNGLAARALDYRGNVARLDRTVGHVFVVQNIFVVVTLVGLASACLVFPNELAGANPLGHAASGFLALFWALRLTLQLTYYDRESRRRHRPLDILFTAAFAALTAVFAAAFVRGLP